MLRKRTDTPVGLVGLVGQFLLFHLSKLSYLVFAQLKLEGHFPDVAELDCKFPSF
jgi:hypothetical protein